MRPWLDTPFLTLIMIMLAGALAFLIPRHWWNGVLARRQRLRLTSEVLLPAVPLAVALQTQLVKELTHYHTPRMDALLQKLGPPVTLTAAEATELQAAILEREGDMGNQISPEERQAAHILPVVIQRAQRELEQVGRGPVLAQLVLLPQPLPEDRP
jgi:hypothetical protein